MIKRRIAPFLLLLAGMWLLIGCIYIPTFNRVIKGEDPQKKVGYGQSKRPLRVLHSHRDQVVQLLGEPLASADQRVLTYAWQVEKGVKIWPFCFTAESVKSARTLVLRFDEDGTLRSFEVLHADFPSQLHNTNWTPLPPELMEQFKKRR